MLHILVTDTHAGARNDNQAIAEYQNRIWKRVFDYADKYQIKSVLHGGDFFDKRQHTTHKTLYNVRNGFLKYLRDSQVEEFHIDIGNHDVAYRNTNDVNAPEMLLESEPKIKVHRQPGRVGNVTIIPWINGENYQQTLQLLKTVPTPFLLGHFEIQGFEMHKGIPSEGGMDPSLFSMFERVFSGHFHTRSSKKNVTYLGSLFEMNWSDWDDPRGFHTFDDETGELTFIPNDENMFFKVEWDDRAENVVPRHDSLETTSGKFIKINVHSKTDPLELDRYVDSLFASGASDVQVNDMTRDTMQNEQFDAAMDDGNNSTEQLISSYVDSLALSQTKTSHLKKLLSIIHAEASSQ